MKRAEWFRSLDGQPNRDFPFLRSINQDNALCCYALHCVSAFAAQY